MMEKAKFDYPEKDYSEKQVRTRIKITQIALILPAVGVLLFLTPLIDAFTYHEGKSSISLLIFYIFGFWGLLIGCAIILAHLLLPEVEDDR